MDRLLQAREKIYDHIEDWSKCHWHSQAVHNEFVTYCVGKDTIQDTGECLIAHREKGFTQNVYERYFEYYGILQAVYMQQDAICALHLLFLKRKLKTADKPNWNTIRDLRNDTAGHPVGRKRFLNRNIIGYDRVNYSWWPEGTRFQKSEDITLGDVLDAYADEAGLVLESIVLHLEEVCSRDHT